jgi:hypothetical protein
MTCVPSTKHRLLPLASLLALSLLTGCSSESRDKLWRTLDPAGYKHAHMSSFNGGNARRMPRSAAPASDEMALELTQ